MSFQQPMPSLCLVAQLDQGEVWLFDTHNIVFQSLAIAADGLLSVFGFLKNHL